MRCEIPVVIERSAEPCCVVDSFCEAPANRTPAMSPRFECYRCGHKVCAHCSMLVMYPGNRKRCRRRLCHDCIAEIDGNDDRVMGHIRLLAARS